MVEVMEAYTHDDEACSINIFDKLTTAFCLKLTINILLLRMLHSWFPRRQKQCLWIEQNV